MINIAMIGVGAWGRNLFRNMLDLKGAQLTVCCDTNGERCESLAGSVPGVQMCQDPDVCINDPSVDAVVIATPAITHYDLASRALAAGKDVFVEKPITLTLEDARSLVKLAEERDRILMVGHLLEYHAGVEKMKELLDSGEIGDPYYIYSERVNLGRIRSDENALWSFAPHDISIILHLLQEEPLDVAARGAAYIREGIEDVVFVTMRFPDKKMAQIHVSWLDPHKIRRTTLVGSKKMVVFDDMQASEKIKIYDKGVELNGSCVTYADSLTLRFGEIVVPALKLKEPLRTECNHFVECVETRRAPRSDGQDGLRVVRVLDAAQRSLKNGGCPMPLK